MSIIPEDARASTLFFSAIPRHVFTLRQNGTLKARDVEVLGLLLDYKRKDTTTVEPSQDTLCRRLRCKHDTIQRSVKRLVAAGLVVTSRLRDLRGRLGKYVYNLAAVFALMPPRATEKRTGSSDKSRMPPKQATTHESVDNSVESSLCSVKADNSAAPQAEPSAMTDKAAAVVSELLALKTERKTAVTIVTRHGEEICRAALAMLSRQKSVTNPTGWLRTCLSSGWVEKEQRTARQENPAKDWKLSSEALILSACLTYGRQAVGDELSRRYARSKAAGEDMSKKDAVLGWFQREVMAGEQEKKL